MSKKQNILRDLKNSPEYWEELTQLEYVTLLNEEMQNKGLTNQQLADILGVSKSYVSKVLNGEKVNFTIKSMVKFMFALGRHLCFSSEPLKNVPVKNLDELMFMLIPEREEVSFTLNTMRELKQKDLLSGAFAA